MSDRKDLAPASLARALPGGIESIAHEDLVSLQSALEGWQQEREHLLARSQAVEADAQAKLQHTELRLHQVVSQLEATQRSAHAVRVRLEAEAQAARTRAEQAQDALAADQAAADQLRVVNAELSTALDATQWRLGQLEAETVTSREALQQMERERLGDHERLATLELNIASERQAMGEATARHAVVAGELAALQTRAGELEEAIQQLQADRAQLATTAREREEQRLHEAQERDALQQRLGELDADRAQQCEREAALRHEIDELRETHELTQTAAVDELARLRADLAERDHALAEAAESATQAHAAYAAQLQTSRDAELQHQADLAATQEQVATLATRARGLEDQLILALEDRKRLDDEIAAMRAARIEVDAQQRDDREILIARASALDTELQQRDTTINELRDAENEWRRLQSVHGEELTAWQEISAQREADLVAARNALATELADEQARSRAAQDHVATLSDRIQGIEADLQGALNQRQNLEQHLSALRDRIAEHDIERGALASRIGLLENDLQERDAKIDQLRTEIANLNERQGNARQAAGEAARRREDEWRATHKTLQDELVTARRALGEMDGARIAAEQRSRALEERLVRQTAELNALGAQTEACVAAEQRATDSEQRCERLAEQVSELRKQATPAQHRHDAMAAQLSELENERSALNLRVDELTALSGQVERECERLRRDRGSSEDTRRLKAENNRLEAKIVELDRQRGEAVQRHSAAVAGYMVELNQRSEALHAREVELQKLTEELTLVKQSCEDAVSELEAQRRQQAALERQLAESRATPLQSAKAPAVDPNRDAASGQARGTAAPPAAVKPAAAKPAKRPAYADTVIGPATVVHLEESNALCEAAREIVGRLPDSTYTNALEALEESASGSRLLAINLLNRAQDPVAAILSFIAADTYHRSVLAYCADGANGFSFGTADFFAQPIDPDACVARLLESVGAIQRLLVVSENFSVVGALRGVLSRMRSSVSAALDLRQVIDLLPMVEPDVVLIDLALPRGEGLRLVSRLQSDPKTREIALGILLGAPGNAAEFRQHALRATRDLPMTASDLAETIGHRLGALPPPVTAMRLQPTASARA